MHKRVTLKIDIQTYWHAGTGRGRSYEIDSVVHRDRDGLPALPGRTVKGLLRDAVAAAEALGWYDASAKDNAKKGGNKQKGAKSSPPTIDVVNKLFGPLGTDGAVTHPGWLLLSDAILADDIREILRGDSTLRSALFSNVFSTAIEHGSGSALNKTLRGIEVAVPVALYAALDIDSSANLHGSHVHPGSMDGKVLAWINTALPLIRGVGSHRHRGMGRATFTLSTRAE